MSLLISNCSVAEEGFVILEYKGAAYQKETTAGGHYKVKRGDTLYSILTGKFGKGADIPALTSETVKENPHAFLRGNANALLAGKKLTLPRTHDTGESRHNAIYFF
jgi:Tfp pilus assembly protein FimV